MTKSDDDNRSNQLNPNNDAYYSSRGTSKSGGDDDDDHVFIPAPVRPAELAEIFRERFHAPRTSDSDLWRYEKRFFFDLVDLDGNAYHFQLVGRAFDSMLNAEDVAEKWMLGLRGAFNRGEPLAMYRAIDPESGREYSWMSNRYQPGRNTFPHIGDLSEKNSLQVQLDAKWEKYGKAAVDQVFAGWRDIVRMDLGACTEQEMRMGSKGWDRLAEFSKAIKSHAQAVNLTK